jgi:putative N-acetylmannosamine-6-phosphate epimerase
MEQNVQRRRCNQCLFSDDKIVSDDRKAQILSDCKTDNTHFECHKATIKGVGATCRGFYDLEINNTDEAKAVSKIFEETGLITFVDIK